MEMFSRERVTQLQVQKKSVLAPALREWCVVTLAALAFSPAGDLLVNSASALNFVALTNSVPPNEVVRFEKFKNFQIKGVCGTARLDLASAYGANTIRTYTPPSREQLDEYQRLGLKVIVGIWMPSDGENKGKDGKWDYDYRSRGDEHLKALEDTMDRIGNHPAILMWCFGNEVHVNPAYLQTVNRMSELLHKKQPNQLTSLTMVNAPREKLALIKQHAPDLDVIGFNSYGHGAVGGAMKNLEEVWGRAYYVSEFGPQGPWWGRKTAWGAFYEQSYDEKLADLRQSFTKIDAAPRCLGSTMFLWGSWSQQLPTYFSAFLTPDISHRKVAEEELLLTPMTEEFCNYWSGHYPTNRAPVLTKISIAGSKDGGDTVLQAGEQFNVSVKVADSSIPIDQLRYRWWVLDKSGKAVIGPKETEQPHVKLSAPTESGSNYNLMVYVVAPDKRASGFTVPVKVEDKQSASLR
jgi:hypothetical protein